MTRLELTLNLHVGSDTLTSGQAVLKGQHDRPLSPEMLEMLRAPHLKAQLDVFYVHVAVPLTLTEPDRDTAPGTLPVTLPAQLTSAMGKAFYTPPYTLPVEVTLEFL